MYVTTLFSNSQWDLPGKQRRPPGPRFLLLSNNNRARTPSRTQRQDFHGNGLKRRLRVPSHSSFPLDSFPIPLKPRLIAPPSSLSLSIPPSPRKTNQAKRNTQALIPSSSPRPGHAMPSSHEGIVASALLLALLLFPSHSDAIRSFPASAAARFAEAPQFRNGDGCPASPLHGSVTTCDPSHVHIAMTLDSHYLRGSIAAVFSILKHASCPESFFFHFVASAGPSSADLYRIVHSVFPSLRFKIYPFEEKLVRGLISTSIREALENPLNYARNYLADLLEPCVERVIYLDSDLVVVDDIRRLWDTRLPESAVIAAPEYCHANITRYFTADFWESGIGRRAFDGRRRPPCYFNTGVMVMDLTRWRAGEYRQKIEHWMKLQRISRFYDLGSLPPFLLVFAGEVEGVDHRWNQHGLGGDNVSGNCRPLHPGPVSLMHWSGKGKPWARLDAGKPCPLDHLWVPYDLYLPPSLTSDSAAAFSSL